MNNNNSNTHLKEDIYVKQHSFFGEYLNSNSSGYRQYLKKYSSFNNRFTKTDNYFHTNNSLILSDYLVENISSTNENEINNSRLQKQEDKFKQALKKSLIEENFEYGIENKTDYIFREQMKINSSTTLQVLNSLFVENFGNNIIVTGILRLISRCDADEMSPQGEVMALAALSNRDVEIKESAIRVFESWCTVKSLEYLREVDVKDQWLKEYLDSVIEYIQLHYDITS